MDEFKANDASVAIALGDFNRELHGHAFL